MKKFMVIFGIVCVLFCGTVMVGFVNNQNEEEIQEEVSEEVYYSDEEMNEFASQAYNFFYEKAHEKAAEGYGAYDFMDYMADEYGFEVGIKVGESYTDEDGVHHLDSHFVASKELSTGQILEFDC